MESRIIHGLKVVEAEPGAPLPPGVPAEAVRCELVELPDLSPALKPWVVGVGAAGAAGGAVALAFSPLLAIPLLLLSLMLLFHGLVPGVKRVVMPSPDGRYLAFEADADEARREAPFDGRMLFRAAGVFVLANVADRFVGRGEWPWLLIASLVGFGLLYFGSRRNLWDVSGAAASLRFRALADPARPLADDAAISGGEEIADRAVASPTSARGGRDMSRIDPAP
jgi:hypothetical protein